MDAGDRAELEALRRRAYGPDADIHDDAAALARLIELEDLARPAVVAVAVAVADQPDQDQDQAIAASPVGPATALPTAETGAVDPGSHAAAPSAGPRRWSALRGVFIAGAAAAIALLVTVVLTQPQSAPAPADVPTTPVATADPAPLPDVYGRSVPSAPPGTVMLMTISLATPFTSDENWPIDGSAPDFPSSAPLNWATPLGKYFGWQLWVAGGGGYPHTVHCILIEHGSDVRARCLTQADQDAGMLRVELATPDIAPGERPPQMASVQSIRFSWIDVDRVDVMLGSFRAD